MVTVHSTDLTFDSVRQAPYFPARSHAGKANLLCIPEGQSPDGGWCFPESSIRLIDYMGSTKPDGIDFDIAVEEDSFREVQRHSALIDLGAFLLKEAVISIFLNVISSFIYDWICPAKKDSDRVELKVRFIAEDSSGMSKSISYQGPVSGLSKIADIMNGLDSE